MPPAKSVKSVNKATQIPTPKRRRMSCEARERQIVSTAAQFFAECGCAASTRDLADKRGVTQALLYRYFTSKDDLLDAVFTHIYIERWDPAWETALADRRLALEERLYEFLLLLSPTRGHA
jgi:AcrR family transcriptional regulator